MLSYPIVFNDTLDKSRPWGGNYIAELKGLKVEPGTKIGESWEVSANPSLPGIIKNGPLAGKKLADVVKEHPTKILGNRVAEKYDNFFPLLLKLLDANDNLSVQVHPPTDYAKEHHGDRFGKEEAWYVLPGSEGGIIYLGLTDKHTPEEFEAVVRSGKDFDVAEYLNEVKVTPGELYFLKTGTLHALGSGSKILEIQRDSDRTYRVYDFNRKGNDGKPRELHLDHGLKVINSDKRGQACLDECKISPKKIGEGDLLHLDESAEHFQLRSVQKKAGDSLEVPCDDSCLFVTTFTDLMVTAGGESVELKKGHTALIPAICKNCMLDFDGDGLAVICYVPR